LGVSARHSRATPGTEGVFFLLERQRISSRLDFSQCAHNDGKLAPLVHANNPAKIDIVNRKPALSGVERVDDIISYHDVVIGERRPLAYWFSAATRNELVARIISRL